MRISFDKEKDRLPPLKGRERISPRIEGCFQLHSRRGEGVVFTDMKKKGREEKRAVLKTDKKEQDGLVENRQGKRKEKGGSSSAADMTFKGSTKHDHGRRKNRLHTASKEKGEFEATFASKGRQKRGMVCFRIPKESAEKRVAPGNMCREKDFLHNIG